jgi:hypothetical protein
MMPKVSLEAEECFPVLVIVGRRCMLSSNYAKAGKLAKNLDLTWGQS